VVFKTTAIDHSAIPPRRKTRPESARFGRSRFGVRSRSRSPLFRPNRTKSVWARTFRLAPCHFKCHRRRPRHWPNRLPLYRSARPGEIGPIRSTITASGDHVCDSSVVATAEARPVDSVGTEIAAGPQITADDSSLNWPQLPMAASCH